MPTLAAYPIREGKLPKVARFISDSFDVELLNVKVLSTTECQEAYPDLSNDTPICAKPCNEQENFHTVNTFSHM